MNTLKDIILPDNIIRVRFLPLVIIKAAAGILLAPALVAGAVYISFVLDPAWPHLLGRGIIPLSVAALVVTLYLMQRFVIMLTAGLFTSEKLIIRYQLAARKSIRWRDISSVEVHRRKNTISVNREDGRRFELKGFRVKNIRAREIINGDYIERAPYEQRFNGLLSGVTISQYLAKLRRFMPEERIIEIQGSLPGNRQKSPDHSEVLHG